MHFTSLHCVCVRAVEWAPTPGEPVTEGRPQCPVLRSLLSSCRLRPMDSFTESVHLTLGLPLFPLLLPVQWY